jgi:hypothetical protein
VQIVDTIRFYEPPAWKNQSFLHQKYVLEGLSLRQIASEVMSSKYAVRKEILEANIKLRGKSHHNGNPSQVKFGQRVVKKKLIDLKVEQRVIDSVRKMKEEGLGLRAIARCLNEMKIPTKNRGKAWHPEMVKRLID